MKFIDPVKQPCNDCPFRRDAVPGWLGRSSPEGFVDCINRSEPLPCHQTINYEDPQWQAKWNSQRANLTGKACAGALIFTANIAKHPRDPAFPQLPADRTTVFSTVREFVNYHRSSPVRSWNEDDQLPEVIELRKRLAPYLTKGNKP